MSNEVIHDVERFFEEKYNEITHKATLGNNIRKVTVMAADETFSPNYVNYDESTGKYIVYGTSVTQNGAFTADEIIMPENVITDIKESNFDDAVEKLKNYLGERS